MPLTYHVHKHLLRKDNQLLLVTEREWGFATLTGDQLQEFTRDMQEVDIIEQQMIATGQWITENLPATHELMGYTLTIPWGLKVTLLNEHGPEKPPFHEHYAKWAKVMQADPNTTYIPPYWVD